MTPAVPLDPPARLVRAQWGVADSWLARLPRRAAALLARWELTAERVAEPGGRSSMVVLVRTADGVPAALKLCAPGAPAALEHAALARWDGWGAVRPLRYAAEDGALLLERSRGEVSLRALPESKAVLEAVSVARRLWVDPGERHPFPTVTAHTGATAAALATTAPSSAAPLVDEAVAVRAALLDSPADAERRLLHGDFRQAAVLAGRREGTPWQAVGPEPVVGEPAYDLARLVRDRLHDLFASPAAAAVTRRRVTLLAEAVEVDAERLRGWALFRAVESGVRHLSAGRREDGELLLEFASWL